MLRSLCCAALVAWSIPSWGAEGALTSAEWQADLEFVFDRVVTVHPHPFGRTGEWEFRAAARDLRRDIPRLSAEQIVVRMTALVARLEDGHTSVESYVGDDSRGAFTTRFPVRFRRFSDGLFVTLAPASQPELVGAEVLRLGSVSGEEAYQRAGSLVAAENEEWVAVNAPAHLSSGEALVGLGILEEASRLALTVRLPGGEEREVELESVVAPQSRAWFWRWLRSPVGTETVHGFAELPLHLAQQVAGAPSYDFSYVADSKTLYCHLIGFWDAGDESLLAFWDRLWAFYDGHDV